MIWFTLGTVVWLLLSGVMGFYRGFWKALAAFISLVGAYVFSVVGAPYGAQFAAHNLGLESLSAIVLWGFSAAVIFVVSGFVLRLLVSLLAKMIPELPNAVDKAVGAVLGLANGAVLSIGIIWAAAFLFETSAMQQGVTDPKQIWQGHPPAVVNWSRSVMAGLVQLLYPQSSSDDALSSLSSAFVEQPSAVMHDINTSLQSQEFRELIHNQSLVEVVRENDVEQLASSREFQNFIEQPSMKNLVEKLAVNENPTREDLAQQALVVWQKIDRIKHNPEMQSILNDSEVKAFLDGNGQVSTRLLEKADQVLKLISEE